MECSLVAWDPATFWFRKIPKEQTTIIVSTDVTTYGLSFVQGTWRVGRDLMHIVLTVQSHLTLQTLHEMRHLADGKTPKPWDRMVVWLVTNKRF